MAIVYQVSEPEIRKIKQTAENIGDSMKNLHKLVMQGFDLHSFLSGINGQLTEIVEQYNQLRKRKQK